MNNKEFLEKLINDIEEQNEIVSKEPHLIINIKVNAEAFIPLLHNIKQDLDRLEKLEEENKVLLVNKNVAQCIAKKFKEENDKYKKAITLLKKKFVDVGLFIDRDDADEYNFDRDSDEDRLSDFEFEFLKEVLGND